MSLSSTGPLFYRHVYLYYAFLRLYFLIQVGLYLSSKPRVKGLRIDKEKDRDQSTLRWHRKLLRGINKLVQVRRQGMLFLITDLSLLLPKFILKRISNLLSSYKKLNWYTVFDLIEDLIHGREDLFTSFLSTVCSFVYFSVLFIFSFTYVLPPESHLYCSINI